MEATVKVLRINDELGITLPSEILKRLNVRIGDTLYLTEHPAGIHLSPINPETLESMNHVMRKNRDVLKLLADS